MQRRLNDTSCTYIGKMLNNVYHSTLQQLQCTFDKCMDSASWVIESTAKLKRFFYPSWFQQGGVSAYGIRFIHKYVTFTRDAASGIRLGAVHICYEQYIHHRLIVQIAQKDIKCLIKIQSGSKSTVTMHSFSTLSVHTLSCYTRASSLQSRTNY